MPFIHAPGHPALSSELTHLTGRRGQPWADRQQAWLRLYNILWTRVLLGSVPYGAETLAVSFTESRVPDLEFLFRAGLFDPWGVVLTRDDIFDAGGAPVWSVRTDVLAAVPDELRVWTARLEPGQSEWLHEREWRIPGPRTRLGPPTPQAVIVGDPNWRPTRWGQGLNPWTNRPAYIDQVPPITAGVPRWFWDRWQQRIVCLPPWQDEYRDI